MEGRGLGLVEEGQRCCDGTCRVSWVVGDVKTTAGVDSGNVSEAETTAGIDARIVEDVETTIGSIRGSTGM